MSKGDRNPSLWGGENLLSSNFRDFVNMNRSYSPPSMHEEQLILVMIVTCNFPVDNCGKKETPSRTFPEEAPG
jgi:hypothetical protein